MAEIEGTDATIVLHLVFTASHVHCMEQHTSNQISITLDGTVLFRVSTHARGLVIHGQILAVGMHLHGEDI